MKSPERKTGKRIAVVGSGPAGLAASQQLAAPQPSAAPQPPAVNGAQKGFVFDLFAPTPPPEVTPILNATELLRRKADSLKQMMQA